MDHHCSNIGCDENTTSVGGDTQNFGIGGAVRNYTCGVPEVNRGFPSTQASDNVRIETRVSLVDDLQASLAGFSALTRSIISAGIGYWVLISSKIRS